MTWAGSLFRQFCIKSSTRRLSGPYLIVPLTRSPLKNNSREFSIAPEAPSNGEKVGVDSKFDTLAQTNPQTVFCKHFFCEFSSSWNSNWNKKRTVLHNG